MCFVDMYLIPTRLLSKFLLHSLFSKKKFLDLTLKSCGSKVKKIFNYFKIQKENSAFCILFQKM